MYVGKYETLTIIIDMDFINKHWYKKKSRVN